MLPVICIVLHLIEVEGLDGQFIELNVDAVVSIRTPREAQQQMGNISNRIRCIIGTVDGKAITTVEICEHVKRKMLDVRP